MRILLATDGSEFALEAARECGRIVSELENATVKIINVVDNFTPMATEPFVLPEEFLANVEREMRENAENTILEAEQILRADNRILNIEQEILIGSAGKIIIKEAEKWKADLVVVGSQGYGFWSRAFLGSVSDVVVLHAPCSVLVVKKRKGNPA